MKGTRGVAPASTDKASFGHAPFATFLILALVALGSHANAESAPASDEARISAARAAVKGLGEALKEQLVAAIKADGPVSAIGVCRTIAPAIAEEQSRKHGLEIVRTALRVRNPANAPDAFERKVLEEFVRKIESGADPASLENAETVTEGGKSQFRYMKAIPTAVEPCLACHGSDLKPELKAEVLRLYPDDRATGFKAGDLRGAFSVRQTLK